MRCIVLASGSKGNCLYIESRSSALLLDAGLSFRETAARLACAGGSLDHVEAVLVTHEHSDHIKGVDAVSGKLKVPVYATKGTLREFFRTRRTSKRDQETIACHFGEEYPVGDFFIEAFATSHDAAEPCGFLIKEGDLAIGCCTDTGVVNDPMLARFRQCDAVVLESNHCPVMLREGPYPEMLKRRIRSKHGHLSNTATAECLRVLGRDVGQIMLAHLSEVNNTPDKAKASAMNGLGLSMNEVLLTIATQAGSTPDAPQKIEL